MPLRTRKPTGAVPWPLILVEGGEKSGKSWAAAELSASQKVGRTVWLDLNEGAADEYGAVPGARYEVIEHDGSWPDIISQVTEAKVEAEKDAKLGKPPFVLVIDSMTAEWDLLKDWACLRARSTDSNKKKLARDPNIEIEVSMNFWNDAAGRHRKLMTLLMTFPGIVVMIARGKETAELDASGRPVKNGKDYRVEGHKSLAYDASVWVRLSREEAPRIIGARSVHAGMRPGVDRPKPVPSFTLEWLVFEFLKCDPTAATTRDMVELRPDRLPEHIRDEAVSIATGRERLRDLHRETRQLGYESLIVANEHGQEITLLDLVERMGNRRRAWDEAWQATGEFADIDDRLNFIRDILQRPVEAEADLSGRDVEQVVKHVSAYAHKIEAAEKQAETAGASS
jgi:hypothetical protein